MKLTLVTGSMFAGKTTYVMNAIRQSTASTTMLVTHIHDTRYSQGDELINHNGSMLEHPIHRLETLDELKADVFDAIKHGESLLLGIDEAQFFPDLVDFIRSLWARKASSIEVVVCGLNGDFQQKPFGVEPNWISKLISIATDCVYLKAQCYECGKPASFSIRRPECESEKVVLIGGSDTYTAACQDHLPQ